MERRRSEGSDIALPPFPGELIHYLRMNIKDLAPADYWECSKHDYELANDVQAAWRNGVDDAQRAHCKQNELKLGKAESLKRARAKSGG